MVVVGISFRGTPRSRVFICGGTTGVGHTIEVEREDASRTRGRAANSDTAGPFHLLMVGRIDAHLLIRAQTQMLAQRKLSCPACEEEKSQEAGIHFHRLKE